MPEIEDQQPENAVLQRFVSRGAIGNPIDGVARPREGELQCLGYGWIVFGDKNAHRPPSCSADPRSLCAAMSAVPCLDSSACVQDFVRFFA